MSHEVELYESKVATPKTPLSTIPHRQVNTPVHATTPTGLASHFPTPTSTPETASHTPAHTSVCRARTPVVSTPSINVSQGQPPPATPCLCPCRHANHVTDEEERSLIDKWLCVISKHRITDRTYKDLSQLCMCMPR